MKRFERTHSAYMLLMFDNKQRYKKDTHTVVGEWDRNWNNDKTNRKPVNGDVQSNIYLYFKIKENLKLNYCRQPDTMDVVGVVLCDDQYRGSRQIVCAI